MCIAPFYGMRWSGFESPRRPYHDYRGPPMESLVGRAGGSPYQSTRANRTVYCLPPCILGDGRRENNPITYRQAQHRAKQRLRFA